MKQIECIKQCDNCGVDSKPKLYPLTKEGKAKCFKEAKSFYTCPKCSKNNKKTQKLTDSVIERELKKAGII